MAAARNQTLSLQGMRILAVEDSQDLRDMLIMLLEQQGAKVVGCETASQAFDMLVRGEPFDAAVFDISMPGEDGLSLVGKLRHWEAAQAPTRLPVIALTADVAHDIERQCKKAGFDQYLAKPVSPKLLFSTLRRLASVH